VACQAGAPTGDRFALATPHGAATAAGREAFRVGGNAIDAALAASAALSVAYPHMTGVGGDLFALVGLPSGEVVSINGSGAAPASLDLERIRAEAKVMPSHGPSTITVPGAVDAWGMLEGLGARLGLGAALAPAARLARSGLPVAPSLARALHEQAGMVLSDPGLRAVYCRDGRPLARGETVHDPALASTLEQLAADGPAALYRGAIGERLVVGLRARGAALAETDLATHRGERTPPLAGAYGDAEVLTAPPTSQGCLLLAILAVVERLNLDRDHLGGDAARLASLFAAVTAERDRLLCDPRTGPDLAVAQLSSGHLDQLAAGSAGAGAPAPDPRHGDTVAVVAADGDGTTVSLIHSLYGAFGSGIREPATGIIAQNRGASFVLDPGHPNALAPGRRPAHTLMPVLVRTGGRIGVAAGTMGGSAHPQIHASLLMALLDRAQAPQAAVTLPRWVVGGLGGEDGEPGADTIFAEGLVPDSVTAAVRRAGFGVRRLGDLDEGVGHAQVLCRDHEGRFQAGSDPRADGRAAVG